MPLLALGNAALAAARDLAGRRVPAEVPGMIVAISAVVVVLIGAGAAHLVSERWVMPEARHLILMAGAGFFLIFGHFFIFMAYRVGPTRRRGAVLLLLHRLGGHFRRAGVRAVPECLGGVRHPAGGRRAG